MQEMQVQSLGQEDTLEKEMATYSNILAWELPWSENPGRLQSMGTQRVGHDLVTKQQQKEGRDDGKQHKHVWETFRKSGEAQDNWDRRLFSEIRLLKVGTVNKARYINT